MINKLISSYYSQKMRFLVNLFGELFGVIFLRPHKDWHNISNYTRNLDIIKQTIHVIYSLKDV